MKLVSLNIELSSHYDTVLPFLQKEDPDVICLQEVLEEDFESFKEKLNLPGIFQVFYFIDVRSHRKDLIGKWHGVAIFAKNIINSGAVFYEGKEGDKENTSVLLWADIKDREGKVFKFITTHFPVSIKGESDAHQLKVMDSLLENLNNFPEFIICGDFNAPRGNETFARIAKKYKDNIPPEYKTSMDQNLHRVKGIQFMVDGLFTTPLYKASNVRLVDGVSDHMAIVADID